MVIDTSFDVRTDAGGKDPDTYSPTLCRYHRLLWSKPMPGGIRFELSAPTTPPYYLQHRSDVGEFWLSSDSVHRNVHGIQHAEAHRRAAVRRRERSIHRHRVHHRWISSALLP
jgi:hypothetical protein